MARQRADYVKGTVENTNGITASATSLTSAGLARLPVVASPDVAAVILHDGTNYEIVHVTAHTAAATTATILRGQEGSTARAWVEGAPWFHGLTVADAVQFAGVTVQDENANVATAVTQIDFQGAGVTATSGTGEVVVTIPGGGANTKTINAQTGTAYTLALTDGGFDKFLTMTNAAASTLTVPPNSSVAFPVGTVVEGAQLGAGQVTLTQGTGVTINATPGLKVAAQYGSFALLKTGTDTWLAMGRLAA